MRLGFAQKAAGRLTDSTQVLRLSGDTEYTRRAVGEFAALPECGEDAQRLVTIATVPEGDTRSRNVRLDLPDCELEPYPSSSPPEGTVDGDQFVDDPAPDGIL
ncbi:hypothetical protein ACFQX6_29015 [Streptosporangium lutulentum]